MGFGWYDSDRASLTRERLRMLFKERSSICGSELRHVLLVNGSPIKRGGYLIRAPDWSSLSDPEHLRPTGRAGPLGRRPTVLHGDRLRILDLHLGLTLHTVCLHINTPFSVTGWLR